MKTRRDMTWPAFDARAEAAGFHKQGKVYVGPDGRVVEPVVRKVTYSGYVRPAVHKRETLRRMESA